MDHQFEKCLGCAYELHGHPEKGQCPECGRPYGDDLILIGTASGRSSLVWMSVFSAVLTLFGGGILFRGVLSGILSFLGLVIFLYGLRGLIKVWRIHLSRKRWGGDMRWVVSGDGIRVRRGLKTELKLLKWRDIADIKKRRGFAFRPVRGLKMTRRFFSIDLVRYKSPPIWLGVMTKDEILGIRRDVLSKRP